MIKDVSSIKSRILVVDDERDIVNLIGYHLSKSGNEIIQAYNGAEALEKIQESKPDLVILDIMMPELDGYTVCRTLRQQGDPATRDIPVVMLTAKAEAEDKRRGLSIGADDYIVKPFDLKELALRTDNLLSRRRAKMEVEDKVRALEEGLYKQADLKSFSPYYHCLNGRLRIRVPGLKGCQQMASDIERKMASVKGVIKMDTSLVTGSILIYFDPARANADFIIGYLNSTGRLRDALPHAAVRKEKGETISTMVGKTVIQSVIEKLILAAI
jgi:CheY-like chemotaxis protein